MTYGVSWNISWSSSFSLQQDWEKLQNMFFKYMANIWLYSYLGFYIWEHLLSLIMLFYNFVSCEGLLVKMIMSFLGIKGNHLHLKYCCLITAALNLMFLSSLCVWSSSPVKFGLRSFRFPSEPVKNCGLVFLHPFNVGLCSLNRLFQGSGCWV